MKIFELHQTDGISIDHHQSSNFYLNRIAFLDGKVSINYIHLLSNGIIGMHEAPVNQLLVIVDGSAIVSTDTVKDVIVNKNHCIYFSAGELHETRTVNGLTAMVIESPDLSVEFLQKRT